RKRRLPIIGDGAGVWSFLHISDAASATLAALEHGRPGVYNVVDDEPARVTEWLPFLARAVGAKPPPRVPGGLGRAAAGGGAGRGGGGGWAEARIRGSSKARGKGGLGWEPGGAGWGGGFSRGLSDTGAAHGGGERAPGDHGRDLSAAPAADVLDRLPDARQR